MLCAQALWILSSCLLGVIVQFVEAVPLRHLLDLQNLNIVGWRIPFVGGFQLFVFFGGAFRVQMCLRFLLHLLSGFFSWPELSS